MLRRIKINTQIVTTKRLPIRVTLESSPPNSLKFYSYYAIITSYVKESYSLRIELYCLGIMNIKDLPHKPFETSAKIFMYPFYSVNNHRGEKSDR